MADMSHFGTYPWPKINRLHIPFYGLSFNFLVLSSSGSLRLFRGRERLNTRVLAMVIMGACDLC